MATLNIEVPDEILSRLNQTGHSAQEIILDAIVRVLANEPEGLTVDELTNRLSISDKVSSLEGDIPSAPSLSKRRRKPKNKNLPREEVLRRLLESGFVRRPEEYDSTAAQEWLSLSEEERQQHIKEMNEMYFPDSPASTYIIESRR